MEVLNSFMTWIFKSRLGQLEQFRQNPIDTQSDTFFELIDSAKKTDFRTLPIRFHFLTMKDSSHL